MRIQDLESNVKNNNNELCAVKSKCEELAKSLLAMEKISLSKDEEIEDLRNRQMRKTLVFWGVKEESEEKSWEDTEKVLRQKISEVDSEFPERSDIERCHRNSKSKKISSL